MSDNPTYPFERETARSGRYDGRFIVGVLSTKIYCLPSCAARPPKPENVRLFRTEDEAKQAGLRACKRCRPDLYYRGENSDLSLFEGLSGRVRADPASYPDVPSLAVTAGVSQTKLGELMRVHAHQTPAQWLRRERVRQACALLSVTTDKIAEVGFAAGFESESVFYRQFFTLTHMTPGAWRALKESTVFVLHLPAGWRATEILAYHARDAEGVCERVAGNRLFKALQVEEGPFILEIALEDESAFCRVHAGFAPPPSLMETAHRVALRMLGLCHDVASFERAAARDGAIGKVVARRKGLRVQMTATAFDGLCWAIVGQQINVPFAVALRRELLQRTGTKIDGMVAHPAPADVANLDVADLTARRFSRSKALYLIETARAVAEGRLDVDRMHEMSAVGAEKALTSIRGVGTWTARYMLMRGAGFADCAPVGDSALATALQKLHGLDERPAHESVHGLMAAYAPHRSLATCHLWASLKDAA
jgi:AraC family transcriptional regulator of adaptative response / DNA-3-methyladenine glycosylase II